MRDEVGTVTHFNVRSVLYMFHLFVPVHVYTLTSILPCYNNCYFLTLFKFCVSLIGDLHVATFIINVICSPFMQQQVA